MEYREFTEKELKWIKSFQKVMKKAPNTLILYAGGHLTVNPLDENNQRYLDDGGGMDGCVPKHDVVTKMPFDGVDW